MEGEGQTVWLSARMPPGFYDRQAARDFLEAELGPSPFAELARLAIVRGFVIAIVLAIFTGGIRRRRRRLDRRYYLAGVPIPEGQEHYHVLVCGSPGSGSRRRSRTFSSKSARAASAPSPAS